MRELRAHVHGQDETGAAEGAEVALQVRLLLHRLRGGLAHHEGHEGQGKLSYCPILWCTQYVLHETK